MTREEVAKLADTEAISNKCIVFELATGVGKSKIAIDLVNSIVANNKNAKVLLLVAKKIHKQNWIDEINKWSGKFLQNTTIECYESLKKYEDETFDIVIADEAHHLNSDLRLDLLFSLTINSNIICLSATMPVILKTILKNKYSTSIISVSLQEAIDNNILPSPKILLLPLHLDSLSPTEVITKNPKAKGKAISCKYIERWNFIKQKNNKVLISCTQIQYYEELCSQITFWKRRTMQTNNEICRNKWLSLCGQRLKWLSDCKSYVLQAILVKLKHERVITFCNSIAQTELLGKYCINSKNKESENNILLFNNLKINHITSCNMVNEGMNLVDTRFGIYGNLNASETITRQRMGRLLRHKEPIIIIPYFVGTREEELVEKMIMEYDKDLIILINSISDIDKFI